MSLDELDELHDSLARARQRIETSDRRVHVLEIELRGVRELLAKEQKRRRVEDRLKNVLGNYLDRNRFTGKIRLGLGQATYPDEGETAEEIIKKAKGS